NQLVLSTQPPLSATAGSPFSVVVAVEDGQGNVDTSFDGGVTIADFDGKPLGPTTTVQAVNGVATFSELTLESAVASDYLFVTGDGMATYSQQFAVAAAPATTLVASTPSGVLANRPFGVVVDAEDQYGNVDSTFNGNVTLNLVGNTGSATLTGTLT